MYGRLDVYLLNYQDGNPLLTGTDTMNQIERIFQIFGVPAQEDINSIPNLQKKNFIEILGKKHKGKNIQKIFPNATPEALDLLKKFLHFNPQKRITIEEALEHPYLKDQHQIEDEPISDPVPSLEFEFEKYNLTIQQLKDLIYEEILLYYFDDFRKEYEMKIKNGQSIMQHILNNENSQMITDDSDEDEDAE
eukprot:TRINITY_DN2417_c0_g1_i4.p1 TRINITY_DN2417_c0_g1~~TRINITY_DN2417_c0_g1_i4.p1  ORF type:complete len:192 (+),score=42.46 TRINITY_DN2417_c0_g1_i4:453-1028(+)